MRRERGPEAGGRKWRRPSGGAAASGTMSEGRPKEGVSGGVRGTRGAEGEGTGVGKVGLNEVEVWKRRWTMVAGTEEEGTGRTRVAGSGRKGADARRARARER